MRHFDKWNIWIWPSFLEYIATKEKLCAKHAKKIWSGWDLSIHGGGWTLHGVESPAIPFHVGKPWVRVQLWLKVNNMPLKGVTRHNFKKTSTICKPFLKSNTVFQFCIFIVTCFKTFWNLAYLNKHRKLVSSGATSSPPTKIENIWILWWSSPICWSWSASYLWKQ